MIEDYQLTLKESRAKKRKLTKKLSEKTSELEWLQARVLGLSIRSLEAKLLRRVFSFLDPNFMQLRVSVAHVCKYWRRICSHKSLASSLAKKPSKLYQISAKPAKGKRSTLQNIMRLDSLKDVVEVERHKKSLHEIEKKQVEEEARMILEYQNADEAEIKMLEDDLLVSRQRKQKQDELEIAANEFFFKAQGV